MTVCISGSEGVYRLDSDATGMDGGKCEPVLTTSASLATSRVILTPSGVLVGAVSNYTGERGRGCEAVVAIDPETGNTHLIVNFPADLSTPAVAGLALHPTQPICFVMPDRCRS